jgi:hypothetical protein
VLWPAAAARAETAPDVAVEIARLRARLAYDNARQHHCLAGATQPVWTASLATDLKALQDRANQAAAEGATAEVQRWERAGAEGGDAPGPGDGEGAHGG